jgi:hypothetical protein
VDAPEIAGHRPSALAVLRSRRTANSLPNVIQEDKMCGIMNLVKIRMGVAVRAARMAFAVKRNFSTEISE